MKDELNQETLTAYENEIVLGLESTPDIKYSHQILRIDHAISGLVTEVGELQDTIKRFKQYGKPIDWNNVREEIGDIFWYLTLLIVACGFNLWEVIKVNRKKIETRYPDKCFKKDKALNRNLEAESVALK